MINRIVRLCFNEDHRDDFVQVFHNHQVKMKSFEKCISLELLEDIYQPGLFFTHSTWESEQALEDYRDSEYFREIWGTIKPWFSERAQAWSLRKMENTINNSI